MAENYMARKDGLWTVVCLSPDVCKTPMGPSTPPIPYQVTASLGNAVQEVKTVKANGCPVVVLEQSFIPTTQGDEPGVAKGIKSGTVIPGYRCLWLCRAFPRRAKYVSLSPATRRSFCCA